MMQWNEWLAKLTSCFRDEYKELSYRERFNVSNLDDFRFPCQADILWANNPRLGVHYQVLIFTHFDDEEDLNLNVYGAFEPYQFPEFAAEMLSQPKWNKSIPQKEYDVYYRVFGYETYGDYLADILSGQYRMMKQYFESRALLTPGSPMLLLPSKQALLQTANDFLWQVWGDLRTSEPTEFIDRIIQDAKSRARRRPRKSHSIREQRSNSVDKGKREKIHGFGALTYPPIWIGEVPAQSPKDRIQGNYIQTRTVFSSRYKSSLILFRQDGFIGIIPKHSNAEVLAKEKAVEGLNEIVATCLALGLPFHAIREPDVADITTDPKTLSITGMSWHSDVYEGRLPGADLWGNVLPSAISFSRKIIPENVILTAILTAEEVTKDKVKKNCLTFLLEAFTALQNTEYSQSFLSSWVILETQIRSMWDEFLSTQSLDKKRSDKLSNPSYWDVDHMLEVLNLSDKVQMDKYNLLMKLKTKRNNIIHSGYKASKTEAEECFQLGLGITKVVCGLERRRMSIG